MCLSTYPVAPRGMRPALQSQKQKHRWNCLGKNVLWFSLCYRPLCTRRFPRNPPKLLPALVPAIQVVRSTQSPRFKRDWEPYSSIAHECSVCARLFDQDADATDATDAILPVWLETSKAKGVEQPLYGNLQCPTHSLGKDNQADGQRHPRAMYIRLFKTQAVPLRVLMPQTRDKGNLTLRCKLCKWTLQEWRFCTYSWCA